MTVYASLWRRFLAYVVDVFVIYLIAVTPFRHKLVDITMFIMNRELFIISMVVALTTIVYWSVLEYKIGQSLGKMLLRIKVRSTIKGSAYRQFFIRNITKISAVVLLIDCLPLVSGHQRYFERISRTEVIGVG